jgi:hypothetical protein
MRMVAALEMLGVIGLFVPYLSGIAPVLMPLAALGLGAIMVQWPDPPGRTDRRGRESRTADSACFVAVDRWPKDRPNPRPGGSRHASCHTQVRTRVYAA